MLRQSREYTSTQPTNFVAHCEYPPPDVSKIVKAKVITSGLSPEVQYLLQGDFLSIRSGAPEPAGFENMKKGRHAAQKFLSKTWGKLVEYHADALGIGTAAPAPAAPAPAPYKAVPKAAAKGKTPGRQTSLKPTEISSEFDATFRPVEEIVVELQEQLVKRITPDGMTGFSVAIYAPPGGGKTTMLKAVVQGLGSSFDEVYCINPGFNDGVSDGGYDWIPNKFRLPLLEGDNPLKIVSAKQIERKAAHGKGAKRVVVILDDCAIKGKKNEDFKGELEHQVTFHRQINLSLFILTQDPRNFLSPVIRASVQLFMFSASGGRAVLENVYADLGLKVSRKEFVDFALGVAAEYCFLVTHKHSVADPKITVTKLGYTAPPPPRPESPTHLPGAGDDDDLDNLDKVIDDIYRDVTGSAALKRVEDNTNMERAIVEIKKALPAAGTLGVFGFDTIVDCNAHVSSMKRALRSLGDECPLWTERHCWDEKLDAKIIFATSTEDMLACFEWLAIDKEEQAENYGLHPYYIFTHGVHLFNPDVRADMANWFHDDANKVSLIFLPPSMGDAMWFVNNAPIRRQTFLLDA